MKKSKKFLLSVVIAVLGLSFCGVITKNAAAATKTTITYQTESYDSYGSLGGTQDNDTEIVGDTVSVQCESAMLQNPSNQSKLNMEILVITDNSKQHQHWLTVTYGGKSDAQQAACDKELPKIKKQFSDNGVNVVEAAAWLSYVTPDDTKHDDLFVSGEAVEVVCKENGGAGAGKLATVYIVTNSGKYSSYTRKGDCGEADSGVKAAVEGELAQYGFTIGWWGAEDTELKNWPSNLVSLGVYPSAYASPETPKDDGDDDDEDPETPKTGDNGKGEGGEDGHKYDEQVLRSSGSFLGMRAWYDGLVVNGKLVNVTDNGSDGSMKLSVFIWTIAANVAIDLAVIAAFGAIGFVIYGGYLYMFSGGDAGKVAGGKKTIMNAIIGLAIAMLANVIFTTMRAVLLQHTSDNPVVIDGRTYKLIDVNPGIVATELIAWVVGVAGIICVVFLVYGGISYISSTGDANKITKAKNAILYSLIGLAIVGLAQVITATVANTIRDADGTSRIETTQIIAKEENEKQIN